jgi:hypothetical protein
LCASSGNLFVDSLAGVRSNPGLIRKTNEEIAGTFATGALFVAGISGCLAVGTFTPIGGLGSNCVNAVAALFADDFGTTSVCDPNVVAGATALGATGNRQFSFHLPIIRLQWAFVCSIQNVATIRIASGV